MSLMRIDNREIRNADIFQTIIDHFPDIIHSVDGEGNIVFANNMAEELFGYPLEKLLTMNVRELYADEVLEALEEGFEDLKETGETAVESMLKTARGETIPVEVRSFCIYDDDGAFIRTFSILRDIRKLKDLQQSLLHAGRLAAIGELASGIVHDISNPLGVLQFCLSNMEKQVGRLKQDGATAQKSIGDLEETKGDMTHAIQSISRLVKYLNNFSRRVADSKEYIDLGHSIGEALFLTKSRTQKASVHVYNSVETGRYFTRGSTNHIEQVFANLISNAVDAMAGEPRRELTLSVEEEKNDDNRYWKFLIGDTGKGIPPEIQNSIFESFFTTKDRDKGTGLGLAIVRGVARDHGGKISFQSSDEGTRFSLSLPQADMR
jgi:PAS domain S-box-containing protein